MAGWPSRTHWPSTSCAATAAPSSSPSPERLLRRLRLRLAGGPEIFRDVVVHGSQLLRLFLCLLGGDELVDPLLSEHPVVDPPFPAVVEGRLFPLRRQDAGGLEHVERVPVLRFEDVVDDPLREAEEVEDVLGHGPGLLFLHPGPVDRVLDRPGEVVHRQRAGGAAIRLRLNGPWAPRGGPLWGARVFKRSAAPTLG